MVQLRMIRDQTHLRESSSVGQGTTRAEFGSGSLPDRLHAKALLKITTMMLRVNEQRAFKYSSGNTESCTFFRLAFPYRRLHQLSL